MLVSEFATMSGSDSSEFVLANGSDTGKSVVHTSVQGVTSPSSGPSLISDDPVCIVGMACRLPGQITSPSDLWTFLSNNRSAQGPVPPERFNIKGFYHPDGSRAGAMNVLGGYFLQEDVRNFDNSFFGINNIEATYMDPQQRKLLEVVFECFEDAGVSMETMSGSETGVYVGNFTVDYQAMQTRDPDYMHRFVATGSGTAIMSNRISHVFNLQGPSLTLDTACSSSIYALHQAAAALQAGDCDGAIVAGANLITSPEQHMGTMKGGVLSPTSTCHTFDSSADGYGRAEGVNAIYVKRLSSAIRAGDNIRAIIRSTAVNSDGYTPGITLPSADAQEKVIRRAYARAGLEFADTDYVECHGTGTAVGDPIEVDALSRCFTPRLGEPLLIGSVKTNLGHSEAASGLTSIMKMVVAFEHGAIPPTHGVVNISPNLKLRDRNMKVVQQVTNWPRTLRRASVNSFGYGGANAHIIMESVDSYLNDTAEIVEAIHNEHDEQAIVLPVTASSPKSLETRVGQLTQQIIPKCDSSTLRRLAITLQRHSNLRVRKFLLAKAKSPEGPVELVDLPEDAAGSVLNGEPLPFAFVFTGQGAQYAGMAKELLSLNASFRTIIRSLDRVLIDLPAEHAPCQTLEECILDDGPTSRVNDVTVSQPLCTAIQIGLISVLRDWGITPSAVVGHSSGEIAAAYAAGLLTMSEAILAAYFRGYAASKLQSKGCMMAAGLGPTAAASLIEEKGLVGRVRVACVNSPTSVTLSGELAGIETLLSSLQSQGTFARKLETGGRAYHSHMMAEVGDLYQSLLSPHISSSRPTTETKVVMYSSVGDSSEGLRLLDSSVKIDMAAYWRENLEQPVQFSAALTNLAASGKHHLLELGPHAALKGPIKQIRTAIKKDTHYLPYTPTLVRNQDADISIKQLAGTLFAHGHALDWGRVQQTDTVVPGALSRMLHDLPPYPWDYSATAGKLWYEPRASVEVRTRKHVRHELLGTGSVTGDGIHWSWRNILRLNEVSWLRDHQLEDQIVFPGAGYLVLAIEAIAQMQGLTDRRPENVLFEFRQVHINEALILPDSGEGTAGAYDRELHTMLSPLALTALNSSADWHEFKISSWISGETTTHCTGRLRLVPQPDARQTTGTVTVGNRESYEVWGMGKWYKKLKEDGLVFGPEFQSLTSLQTDCNRVRAESVSTTHLRPPVERQGGTSYLVHPITIDACLQAAIMGGTAGNLNQLRAHMPVSIGSCRIIIPSRATLDTTEEVEIHTRSIPTGLSTCRIDCTIRAGPEDKLVVDLQDVRLAQYNGKQVRPFQGGQTVFEKRYPCLEVQWKPDVQRLAVGAEDALREYVADFVQRQPPDLVDSTSLPVIAALVDLAGHRLPRMRILELDSSECGCKAKHLLDLLDKETAFPRCRSWHKGAIEANGDVTIKDGTDEPYDMVLVAQHSTSKNLWRKPQVLTDLLAERGVLVARTSDEAVAGAQRLGLNVVNLDQQVLVAVRPPTTTKLQARDVIILTANKPSQDVTELTSALAAYLPSTGVANIDRVSLDKIQDKEITADTVVISLLEMETEFLATISPTNTDKLRLVTDVVTDLLWITGANMMGAVPDPNLTLASGLSRAMMLEQPTLRFTILDLGSVKEIQQSQLQDICQNVVRVLASAGDRDDTEFTYRNGLLYISRFAPTQDLNTLFRRRLDSDEPLALEPLGKAGAAKLTIGQIGVTDTLYFQQIDPLSAEPPTGYVDISLRSVSLNAKDIYTMTGRVETREATTALDIGGVVVAVGPDVKHLSPGDRVAAFVPNHFRTVERVPVGVVHLLRPEESMAEVPAILAVHGTAIHALRNCARLRAGESVLIHAGAGAFGLAAIALARRIGAEVYTTVSSETKRNHLIQELGFPAANIFHSRSASFVADVLTATNGRGVDVIVNSLVGDLLHASWGCLAPFGRFVEIGKRDLVDAGKLDMSQFVKNASFISFDLSELFFADDKYYRDLLDSMMAEVLEDYRAGLIDPGPVKTFDVSEIAQAYRYFSAKDRMGKVVISMEDPQSLIPLAPSKYQTTFSPNKIYLLIGCLGGLGRSLSRWMMARGARRFVFLGRSGCDKPSAAELVNRLRESGAQVEVVRGDVSSAADVSRAVQTCVETGYLIGGVVQAAMGLHEALFTKMTNEAWHTGIDPKWKGTWNIHHALQGHEDALDFFLFTSSVSGSVGTATESNYCAANCFLDGFARWRRAQGKPAVSVGLGMISEVGYLHENPEIEALLLRKGIAPLNEEEFLQVIDYALAGSDQVHILTGLEGMSIRKLMAQGFDVHTGTMQDPRTALLLASLQAEQDINKEGDSTDANAGSAAAAAAWFTEEVPAAGKKILASEASAPSLFDAVLRMTRRQFSNLILMPLDQVEDRRPMSQFGVDSMIASEFRTWFWSAFQVDIPFLVIMSSRTTLVELAECVETKLQEAWKAAEAV
ncbi:hypothetical protein BJY00DRAFT_288259 [Aspergillus carlsbadensis]|nr:hypothetical protein BJY00DRAFT_288259 [Aspergillus carlsbadensis]